MKISVSTELADHITKDVVLSEATPPRFVASFIYLVLLALVGFLIWASFSQLNITAVGQGAVLPSSPVQHIQHPEGGRIVGVHVEEGQTVKKGDLLVTLDDLEQQADYKAAWMKYGAALAKMESLRAFVLGQEVNKSSIPSEFGDQLALSEQALISMRNEVAQIENQMQWLNEIAAIRAELADQKLGTKTQALESKSNLMQLKNELLRIKRTALRDFQQAKLDLAEMNQAMVKIKAKYQRVQLLAGVDGVVQELKFKTPDGVISPGAIIMSLVPVGDPIKAEIRIAPSDIGFIHPGQDVKMKPYAYDYARYGSMSAKVSRVLPGAFTDEKGAPYHKVLLEFGEAHLKNQPDKRLMAGMQVQADIITDQQSVIRYLLRPIFVAFDQGLRER
jgi:adhesin transport system membrane fusion protein